MLTFQSRFDSPIVQLRDYTCRAPRHAPMAEEEASANSIVLLRSGVFEKHFGRKRVTADANQSVFFTKGSTFRVGHPTHCGDRGTVLTFSPDVLVDLVSQFDPSAEARVDRPFPFVTGPSDPRVFAGHRALLARLATHASHPSEAMQLEDDALQLAADALRCAFTDVATRAPRQRAGTISAHREVVERAKSCLAARLEQPLSLADVAQEAHCSPFHLSRIFRNHTGQPMFQYLLRLRLRTALEQIAGGARDLSALALSLGFSSHSHLTSAFTREFGTTPTAVRRISRSGSRTAR